MPVITFELNDLKKEGYALKSLEQILPKIGMEIEEVTDHEIHLSAAPNRLDLLDFAGLIRTLDNFTGKKIPRENFYKIKKEPVLEIYVDAKVKQTRSYIGGLVVKNLDLNGNLLKYLINFTEKFVDTYGRRRKKIAIGLHNLDAVKGNIVYSASSDESFVPLNGPKKISFNEIMQKNDKGINYRDTIPNYGNKNVVYPFIKDDEKILAMIPIINSEATKVTQKTRNLFIDITGTSPIAIENTANLLACSFLYVGAEVYPVKIKNQKEMPITPLLEYQKIRVNMLKVDKVIGTVIEKKKSIALANKMGYVAAQYGNATMFYVPPYRIDVMNEQDVTEDIAIAFGYENIAPQPIVGISSGLAGDLQEYQNKLSVFAVGLGIMEAINSSLTNEKMNYADMLQSHKDKNYISIAESKTENISMLRTMLLPGLLNNLSNSRSYKMPQRLFEVGSTFTFDKNAIKESIDISIVSEHAKANFSEMRSMVDALLIYLDTSSYRILEHKDNSFIEGRCCKIEIDKKVVGIFGELHPKVLQNFGLDEPCVGLELTLIDDVEYKF
ncbi:MAG: phenylalanine--tRNA ligase subunit beta [Candidatus Micrarchaeaceae archaeon]|jgi:phenylalanyl-tRNA synthetase beta chain